MRELRRLAWAAAFAALASSSAVAQTTGTSVGGTGTNLGTTAGTTATGTRGTTGTTGTGGQGQSATTALESARLEGRRKRLCAPCSVRAATNSSS